MMIAVHLGRDETRPARALRLFFTTLSMIVLSLVLVLLCELHGSRANAESISCDASSADRHIWPTNCDSSIYNETLCRTNVLDTHHPDARFLILLNSWEKLTWAKIGLCRLLAMAAASSVSLVEPCSFRGEIGGYALPGRLDLDAYVDPDSLRAAAGAQALIPMRTFLEARRCSGWEAEKMERRLDPATTLDALVLFLWWRDERHGVEFDELGLSDCHRMAVKDQQVFRMPDLEDGTGGTISLNHLRFRSVYCADPYVLREGESGMSRGEWLTHVFDTISARDHRPRLHSFAIGLASYRRTALVRPEEEEWGQWDEDDPMLASVVLPPPLATVVHKFQAVHLPPRYLAVHFRAGRVLNQGTIINSVFQRQAYTESELPRMLAYPAWCANKIVDAARQIMEEYALEGVLLASDLDPANMPELDRPESHPPLLATSHRAQWLSSVAEARQTLQEGLNSPRSFDPSKLPDPVGMGAAVDVELLAGGEVFLYAGQYAGVCEPTGYGSQVVRVREQRGAFDRSSSRYLTSCCLTGG